MIYSVIQSGNGRILMAEGGVGSSEGARLAAAISSAGNIDEVWLASPGGDLAEGIKMGRILRGKGLSVRVPANHACISSCTVAFLGGVIRTVDAGGYYGIHMFSYFFDAGSGEESMKRMTSLAAELQKKYGAGAPAKVYQYVLQNLEQRVAQQAAEMARYLIEMSASLEFLTGMFGQEQRGVCFLSPAGMRRYNVVNSQ